MKYRTINKTSNNDNTDPFCFIKVNKDAYLEKM